MGAEYDANIDALSKASAAVGAGMSGGFLQTPTARTLRDLVLTKQNILDADRQQLLSFLSGSHEVTYAPKSGEVFGILKQLSDDMKAELADATAKEDASLNTHVELVAAKKKQVAALTVSIEEKMARVGKLGVDVVTMKNDLSDTQQALLDDRRFLAELEKSCSVKATEWEERKKTRAAELAAISETIRVLNDDDALELFKKTLTVDGSSFLQTKATKVALKATRALQMVRSVFQAERSAHPKVDFIALAMQGKKIGFEKVLKMIDDMVATLKTEQQDDNQKREYCLAQFDSSKDKKASLERSISDLENAVDVAKDGIATLEQEIKALELSVKDLDKTVAEGTEQRKQEHADYTELIASNAAAKKLLGFAKNTLNRFYNPNLYKPAPKRELSRADRIIVNSGGEAPPEEKKGGIAGTGITVLSQKDAPPPPPETFDAYATKTKESTGVIALMDSLVGALEKEMTEAKSEEDNSQEEYGKLMTDAAAKRGTDLKTVESKQSAKAGLESDLAEQGDTLTSTSKEMMATSKYISNLHGECDWLIQNHEVRKDARATEIDQLQQAKAVLSGADFS